MNEPNPPVAPVEAALPDYKNRSAGLAVFGVLTILLGCLSGLFVPLMLLGQVTAAKTTHTPVNLAVLLPAVSIYGVLAVALVWLGIGSIMARRWARALLLIFSWSWLVMGIVMIIVMAVFLPKVLGNLPANSANGQPAMPPGAMTVALVVAFAMLGFFFVLLPALWTFFYNSRHVQATCEARDPVTRWTDACPLPVLGVCLWLLLAVPMMLIMPVAGHGVMPFFGKFLTGAPGSLLCVAIAAVWGYAAWRLYRLDVRGWWLILIALVLFMVSALVTYAHHDLIEMYRLMGYPEAQIEQIQKTGLLTGNRVNWLMSLSMLPFLGYLLFIKRYLRKA